MKPSWAQVEAQLRGLLMAAAGVAIGRGWISADVATAIVGIALTIGGMLWAMYVNREAALVQFAEAVPSVRQIKVSNTIDGRAINEATGAKTSTE